VGAAMVKKNEPEEVAARACDICENEVLANKISFAH